MSAPIRINPVAIVLTAEELRFINVRRTLTDHGQELLMRLAKSFKQGQDQRGETASSKPRAIKRPKASTLRLVTTTRGLV